jgi:hypothetical protein
MQYLFGTTPQPQEPAGVGQLGSMAMARRVLRQLFERSGNGSLVALRANACTTIRHGKNRMLVCRRGTAWVTQLGVYEDFILRPGQSVRTTRRGSVVVTAVEDIELEIVA